MEDGQEEKTHVPFHFFCKWTAWTTFEQGTLINPMTQGEVGHYRIQNRTCALCNREQLRKIQAA